MRVFGEERGQATILFAIGAVLLLSVAALSMDAGRAYVTAHQLKTAADAAALAGAQDLPGNPSQAQADAARVAQANGVPSGDVQSSVSADQQTITVTTMGTVSYLFAPIFGISHSSISQTSAATVGPVGQVQGAVPIGVFQQSFQYGGTYTLKSGGGEGSCGNYGALSFSGDNEGASAYEDNLKNGYAAVITVGEQITTKPGDMKGPTDEGLSQRIEEDPGATANTVAVGSPRILLLPILQQDGCGRTQVTVVGFAAFFLQSVSDGQVTGVFLHTVMDGLPASTAGNFGLEAERLTQ